MRPAPPRPLRVRKPLHGRHTAGPDGLTKTLGAALLALATWSPAAAEDRAYHVGRQGWSLEFFGADVALMRSASGGSKPSSEDAALTLSCDGRSRRWRLTLSADAMPEAAGPGSVLVRPIDHAGRVEAGFSARYGRAGKDSLLVSNDRPDARSDPVLRLAAMLGTRPAGLDLLLHPGERPVSLRGLTPLRLSLTIGEADAAAFGAFADLCSRPGHRDKG